MYQKLFMQFFYVMYHLKYNVADMIVILTAFLKSLCGEVLVSGLAKFAQNLEK